MVKAHETEVRSVSRDNSAPIAGGTVKSENRKRGRPRVNTGMEQKPCTAVVPKTKIVDGKLMKRAVGMPKKMKTGKPGRPRKEYIWVEAK